MSTKQNSSSSSRKGENPIGGVTSGKGVITPTAQEQPEMDRELYFRMLEILKRFNDPQIPITISMFKRMLFYLVHDAASYPRQMISNNEDSIYAAYELWQRLQEIEDLNLEPPKL